MRRTLVVGIAAALLSGILVATATATVEQTVEGVDDSPITVPNSKVGDEAVFAWFYRHSEAQAEAKATFEVSAEPASQASAEGDAEDWSPALVQVLRVEGLGQSLDQQGRLHDVVVIRSNTTTESYSGTSIQYVELAERSLVRSDYKSAIRGDQNELAFSTFHTPGRGAFFEHQGHTYRLNEEAPSPDASAACAFVGLGIGWHGGPGLLGLAGNRGWGMSVSRSSCQEDWWPQIVSTRTWVAARGIVDGHDAYDIRTEAVLRAKDVSFARDSEGDMETRYGEEYEMEIVNDEWVTADVPYVLLDETAWSRDGKEEGRSQLVLQQYTPGSQEVPWGGTFDAAPPIFARSGNQHFPADGDGSQLPYALSRALADVGSAASAPAFQLWKQTHPAAVLVMARLQIGENSRSSQPSSMWSLIFAEPDGDAHEVATERFQGLTQPLVTDRGDQTIPAFSASILPPNPVTLAEVERAWTMLAPSHYTARGPNYVSWGMEIDPTEGLTCFGSGSSSGGITPEDGLRTVYFGWASEGSCADMPPELDISVLAFDVDRAELLALVEFHDSFDLRPGPIEPHRANLETQAVGGGLRVAKPDVAVATVTSTSLLALFLVGYFLPAIKVVGAQALLLFPGYAKLRKEAILDNKIRDQILESVKQDPGVSITDLSKKVDAGWGTIVYHLGVLEKNKLVSFVLDGRHRRVFPVGLVDFTLQGQLALLKNERVRALYELIHEEPGAFQEQLAKRIGISAPATSWHLKRLEDAGLVGRVKDGRRVHYYANEKPTAHASDGMEVA